MSVTDELVPPYQTHTQVIVVPAKDRNGSTWRRHQIQIQLQITPSSLHLPLHCCSHDPTHTNNNSKYWSDSKLVAGFVTVHTHQRKTTWWWCCYSNNLSSWRQCCEACCCLDWSVNARIMTKAVRHARHKMLRGKTHKGLSCSSPSDLTIEGVTSDYWPCESATVKTLYVSLVKGLPLQWKWAANSQACSVDFAGTWAFFVLHKFYFWIVGWQEAGKVG